MTDPSVFIIIAFFTIASALLIFVLKRVIHAVLALTAAFTMSAVIFLYLDQPLIALLQVLIFVGGLSTYLIVAIGAEEKIQKYSKPKVFLISAVVLAAGFSILLLEVANPQPVTVNSMLLTASATFQQYYILFFASVLLLAASAIGSVLFIKKIIKPVI